MTRIKTTNKRTTRNPLPWIIGLLFIALLVWFAIDRFGEEEGLISEGEEIEAIDGDQVLENDLDGIMVYDITASESYENYMTFIERAEKNDKMYYQSADKAMVHLATALSTVTEKYGLTNDPAVEAARQKMLETAQAVTNNWTASGYPEQLREATIAMMDVLYDIQGSVYPGLADEVAQVQQLATAITTTEPVARQKEQLKAFFNENAAVLREMSIREPTLQTDTYSSNQ